MSGRAWARSIRFRITALATLVVFCVLALAGLTLVIVQRRVLIESLTENLSQRAEGIATNVAAGQPPTDRIGVDDDAFAVVTAPDGSVLLSIPSAATVDLDDSGFRYVTREVETSEGVRGITVAGPLDDIDEATRILVISLALTVPVVVAVLALLIWWLIGRTLRPVEAIRAEVASIGGSDLHRRVPTPDSGDEVESLAHTMNDMLARIEHASERQQQFVADASHELRSPLTRIRSQLEVGLAHPEVTDAPATERSVLEDTIGMQHLVDDLLHLARSDAGATGAADHRSVDLDDIVLAHAARLRSESAVELRGAGVEAVQTIGDASALSRAIGNVVDNAARHAETSVVFTLAEDNGDAVMTITDDGPGVPASDHQRVFERFSRVDEARSRNAGGTGLGLAIAREIIERHGGTIGIDPGPQSGARFVIRLPLEPPERR